MSTTCTETAAAPADAPADVIVTGRPGDAIYLITPYTAAGAAWCGENLPADAPRWRGAYAVESRYVGDIAAGMIGDGLDVESAPRRRRPASAVPVNTKRECVECGRVFDMLDATDADEWHYGHDCE